MDITKAVLDMDASDPQRCDNTLSEDQKKQLMLVGGCTGLGSIFCCIVAISLVLFLRLYKSFTYRLATYQILASLFWNIACGLVLLQLNYDNPLSLPFHVTCYFESLLLEYSMWVKLLFTLWLTFHLFCHFVFLENMKRLEWFYITSSVVLPLLCVNQMWMPLSNEDHSVTEAWCFICVWKDGCATQKYTEGIITFFLFYTPIIVTLTLDALTIFIMVAVMVWRAYMNSRSIREPLLVSECYTNSEVLKQLLPLLAYPIICFTLMLLPTLNLLYDPFASNAGFALIITHGTTIAINGILSGLALIVHICYLHFVMNPSGALQEPESLTSQCPSILHANLSTAKAIDFH